MKIVFAQIHQKQHWKEKIDEIRSVIRYDSKKARKVMYFVLAQNDNFRIIFLHYAGWFRADINVTSEI